MTFSPTASLLMKLLGPALIRAILTRVFRDEVTGSDMAETLTDSLASPAWLNSWAAIMLKGARPILGIIDYSGT